MKIIRGESIRAMHPLFQEGQGGSIPTSPLQMRVERISFDFAKALNWHWHRTQPRFGTGKVKRAGKRFICYGAVFDEVVYAVAIWSAPGARGLPKHWLEMRRFAIAECAPRFLASRMLKVMRYLLRREKPDAEQLVSYQAIGVHSGTIYRAAGWEATTFRNAGEHNCQSRSRPPQQLKAGRWRWQIPLWKNIAKRGVKQITGDSDSRKLAKATHPRKGS